MVSSEEDTIELWGAVDDEFEFEEMECLITSRESGGGGMDNEQVTRCTYRVLFPVRVGYPRLRVLQIILCHVYRLLSAL